MRPPDSRTLFELLRGQAERFRERVAVICGERVATYRALADAAGRIGAGLHAAGFGRGDRVGLLINNRLEWLECCFGAAAIGATVVPFSTWSKPQELAYLLEGDWQAAVAWATDPAIPGAWYEEDVPRIVATGLLRMGIAARGQQPDDVLAQAMRDAPKIIREHGDLLEPVARSLPAHPVLDGAVQLYERLVERAIGGKNRDGYAVAAACCTVIRSMRRRV